MKDNELEVLITPIRDAIRAICDKHDVVLDKIVCSGSLNTSQRKAGNVGRIYLVLGDDAPGWRGKDNPDGRKSLKRAVKDLLSSRGVSAAVMIQANYSELVSDGAMIHRRDSSGKIIGSYEA